MQLIDTHAHIYLPQFDADRAAVLQNALANGVNVIALPAIDAATHAHMLLAEEQWPQCKAMMGLHPCSVQAGYRQELSVVENHLKNRSFIAVGEIGLDFYWDASFKQQQYEAFETQIRWALEYHLPVVIHSRNAMDECIEVVQKFPDLRGVFHCFTGTVAQANRIMEMQFYLGIGGVATYKNSGLDNVIASIGLDAVVLETDAPYLAPAPYRGKRNECSYLPLIAEKLARITGRAVEDVATITTHNAKKLFTLT